MWGKKGKLLRDTINDHPCFRLTAASITSKRNDQEQEIRVNEGLGMFYVLLKVHNLPDNVPSGIMLKYLVASYVM